MQTEFIDSHCHLDHQAFTELPALIERCQTANVGQFIVPATSQDRWRHLQTLAEQFPQIHCAYGVHPWWTHPCNLEHLQRFEHDLIERAEQPDCIAIGETGLCQLKGPPLTVQVQWFEVHIQAALKTQKPLIIHAVKTHAQVLQQLKPLKGKLRGVIHGFSGSLEIAQQYWQLGFYLGIGGTITYPRANKTRKAVQQMPLESLILETDAPDMPLAGQQGTQNSPENLPLIANCLADLRGESVLEISGVVRKNCFELFGI